MKVGEVANLSKGRLEAAAVRVTGGWRSFNGTGTGSGRAARRPWPSKFSQRRGGEQGAGRKGARLPLPPRERKGRRGRARLFHQADPWRSGREVFRILISDQFFLPSEVRFGNLSYSLPSASTVGASLVNTGKASFLDPSASGERFPRASHAIRH